MSSACSWEREGRTDIMDLDECLGFMKSIARGAAEILLRGFRASSTVISYKSHTDLVTNIDHASEEYLFNKIHTHYASHSIVAEEGSRSDSGGEYLWYVDPLDGTNNFAHGIPLFSVSLALCSRNPRRVLAGVVYDAFHDELFSARRGGGAFLNDAPIRVSEISDISLSMLATGFPYDKASSEKNNLCEFTRLVPRIQGIRRLGSAAIDLCYVACGRLDGFWEPKLKPWDSSGGSIIVEEAGGSVSTYDGSDYDPEYPEILATNGQIHQAMIAILGCSDPGHV